MRPTCTCSSLYYLALLLSSLLAGCSQPKSGSYFEPEITARHGGFFSYDITFTLEAVNRVDWNRSDAGQVAETKTPVGTNLRDVALNVTVHYAQGENHETQAFAAKWQLGKKLVVNVPKTAMLQGYDIRGTGYLFDESEACLGTVPVEASFRTNSD